MLPDVAILHWPEDAAVVEYFRAHGGARLLLVAPDADIPTRSGWDEDWIRLPARDEDVRARVEALMARLAGPAPFPEIGTDGRLFFDGNWVPLSPTEEAMARVLSDSFGDVVGTESLAVATGERRLTPTAVRVHLTRLRKRIRTMGLVVRTVRGRGYVLERSVGPQPRMLRRPPSTDSTAITVGELMVDVPRHRVTIGGRRVDLTPTELKFLAILARSPDEIVTYEAILEQVWGSVTADAQYLRVYVAQIRKKLSEYASAPRIVNVPRVGYCLVAGGDSPELPRSSHSAVAT
jgi:DNA-binding response OmpR family regulator